MGSRSKQAAGSLLTVKSGYLRKGAGRLDEGVNLAQCLRNGEKAEKEDSAGHSYTGKDRWPQVCMAFFSQLLVAQTQETEHR